MPAEGSITSEVTIRKNKEKTANSKQELVACGEQANDLNWII
jgi:hypothetical protein